MPNFGSHAINERWVNGKKSVMGLGLALLLALSVAQAADVNKAGQAAAQQLAQAMRLGQTLGMSLLQAVFPQPGDKALAEYKDLGQCLLALKLPEIIDNYAKALREKMTDEEIGVALAFFASPTGKRFDEHVWHTGLQAWGLLDTVAPELSASDRALVEQFAKSKAGTVLWVGRPYNAPAVFKENHAILLNLAWPCVERIRRQAHRKQERDDNSAKFFSASRK